MNQTPPEAANPAMAHSAEPRPESPARAVSDSTPLLWLTVLSLDAPAVAVLWQLLFARSFHARVSASVTLLLALVVWLIYVADRMLDTLKKPGDGAEATRHIFYRRHLWKFLIPLAAGFLLAAWMSLTRLDARTFRYGIVMLFAVSIYLLAVHLLSPGSEWLPKEMLVGVLFALGTCFPVWENSTGSVAMLAASYLLFTALCWLNCAAIEHEEWTRLRQSKFGAPHSWTVWMGRHFLLLAAAAAVATLCLLVVDSGHLHWQLLTAELLSALAFLLIRHRHRELSLERFRVLVDLALFTPVLFLPF